MRFTTDFAGGNGRLLHSEKREWGWEITFLAQTKAREPMPLWFDFRLSELDGEKVRLCLANSMQCLGDALAWGANRPVYRCADGGWKRADRVENRLTGKHTPETWFEVPLCGDTLEFAFFYPYNQAQMTETVEELGEFFEAQVIGYSAMERPIVRYVNGGRYYHPENPGVYLLSRQHAGEASGTYMMDGILRYLASPEGQEALGYVNWWFVPFVDIDGVEEGFYGKDQCYGDLNRGWAPWFAKRTELVSIQYDMNYVRNSENLKLMLDLHAPGHDERDSYFVTRENWDETVRARLREVWESLVRHTDECGYQRPNFLVNPAGENTSAQAGWTSAEYAHSIGVVGCTYECTYQGEKDGRNYEIPDYQRLGRCMAKAIAETVVHW